MKTYCLMKMFDAAGIKDQLITIALAAADGDRGRAAILLNISIRTINREIARRRKEDK